MRLRTCRFSRWRSFAFNANSNLFKIFFIYKVYYSFLLWWCRFLLLRFFRCFYYRRRFVSTLFAFPFFFLYLSLPLFLFLNFLCKFLDHWNRCFACLAKLQTHFHQWINTAIGLLAEVAIRDYFLFKNRNLEQFVEIMVHHTGTCLRSHVLFEPVRSNMSPDFFARFTERCSVGL